MGGEFCNYDCHRRLANDLGEIRACSLPALKISGGRRWKELVGLRARRLRLRSMPSRQRTADIIANQVFLGCPYKTVRAKYERAIDDLNKKFPLSFVIVGRGDGQEAEDLLELIKERLFSSSHAIFDATAGNANVSLEFGLAETNDMPRTLYLSSHAAAKRGSKDSAIIADLAGKRRNQYTQEPKLLALLREFCKGHNYTKRFESFLQKSFRRADKGEKKRSRALALKVVHYLDGKQSVRRADLAQNLLADQSNYKQKEIDGMISRLHKAGLLRSERGRYSTVSIR